MNTVKPCCLLLLLLTGPLPDAEGLTATAPATMPAGAATTAPAPTLSPQDQRLVASTRAYMQQQVQLLRSDDPRQRQKAQQALDELQAAILAPLKEHVAAGTQFDPATAQVLTDLYTSVVMGRMFEGMSPVDREQSLQFSKEHPEIIRQLCSPSATARGPAYVDLPTKDSSRQAEPLLIAALLSNDAQRAGEAFGAIAGGAYASDRMVTVLGDLSQGRRGTPFAQASSAYALMNLPNRRVTPYALAMLLTEPPAQTKFINVHQYRACAAALARFDEVGAVGPLMKDLAPTPIIITAQVPAQVITTAYSDMKVYAVCILTKQDPKSYGILSWPDKSPTPSYIGFEDEAARSKAIAKLQAWWEQAKDKPPYKDAKPLLPAGAATSKPAEQSRPETQP